MNYYPLFRARSWNNGVRCIPFYILRALWDREQVHSGICDSEWSIVGYGTGAFWDLWNWSLLLRNEPATNTESYGTLRPRQNCRHTADDIFKCIFFNDNVWISLKISLKLVPKFRINNIPALVQIMAWRRPGDKPLSEPMMVSILTHICVIRPQWVNGCDATCILQYVHVIMSSQSSQNVCCLCPGTSLASEHLQLHVPRCRGAIGAYQELYNEWKGRLGLNYSCIVESGAVITRWNILWYYIILSKTAMTAAEHKSAFEHT